MSGKKWLPKEDGRGQYWEEEIEKPEKFIPTLKRRNRKLYDKPNVENRDSLRQKALQLAPNVGVIRTKDLEAIGVPRQYPLPPDPSRATANYRDGFSGWKGPAEWLALQRLLLDLGCGFGRATPGSSFPNAPVAWPTTKSMLTVGAPIRPESL